MRPPGRTLGSARHLIGAIKQHYEDRSAAKMANATSLKSVRDYAERLGQITGGRAQRTGKEKLHHFAQAPVSALHSGTKGPFEVKRPTGATLRQDR